MGTINKCLKEWNAIIEALGKGKQSLIIRKNSTKLDKILLYPTYSYANDKNYLLNFKKEYRKFVSDNALPNITNNRIKIKYFVSIEKIIEKSSKEILELNDLYIWNQSHVQFYLDGNNAYVWLLRVYKLKNPYFAEKHQGMTFANLKEYVNIDDSKPVLNNDNFSNVAEMI